MPTRRGLIGILFLHRCCYCWYFSVVFFSDFQCATRVTHLYVVHTDAHRVVLFNVVHVNVPGIFSLFSTSDLSVEVVSICAHLSEAFAESPYNSFGIGVLEELFLFTLCKLIFTEFSSFALVWSRLFPSSATPYWVYNVCFFYQRPLWHAWYHSIFPLDFWCAVIVVLLYIVHTDLFGIFPFSFNLLHVSSGCPYQCTTIHLCAKSKAVCCCYSM